MTDCRDEGQLALMDALVFFVGAILISSMLLSLPGKASTSTRTSDSSIETARLLDSVLSASIGANLTLELDRPVHISRQSLVRDCLAFEADFLVRGEDPDRFSQLNSIVVDMLRECAPSSMEPHLLFVYRSYSEPLLALPHLPGEECTRIASSVGLALEGGFEILVVLVLCPSAPSELIHV